jgi:hypothetical protein
MILASKLAELTSYTPAALTRILNASGYKRDVVTEARFLGMTNGGQFCYRVDYDDFGELVQVNMFVKYDPATGKVTADF